MKKVRYFAIFDAKLHFDKHLVVVAVQKLNLLPFECQVEAYLLC